MIFICVLPSNADECLATDEKDELEDLTLNC